MQTNRLEAFSDGVIAIIITIMVLEMKIPHGADWSALTGLVPVFACYVMSFIYVGIYWNNHHHMLHLTESINGGVLWANMHLLFWLSLIPFVTGWMGENHFAPFPTALYGVVLFCCAIAWMFLQAALTSDKKSNTKLREALGEDFKGKITFGFYALGIVLAFSQPHLSIAMYLMVALIWLVPDRRFEAKIVGKQKKGK